MGSGLIYGSPSPAKLSKLPACASRNPPTPEGVALEHEPEPNLTSVCLCPNSYGIHYGILRKAVFYLFSKHRLLRKMQVCTVWEKGHIDLV